MWKSKEDWSKKCEWIENPLTDSTQMDEAFIGVVSRISRRVAASATISRTIDVYLTLVQKHLNMKVLDWHQEVVWAEKMQKCFWTMVLWVLLFFDQNPQLVREFRTRTRITRRTPKRARIVLKVFFFWLGLLFLSLWPSWYIYVIMYIVYIAVRRIFMQCDIIYIYTL